MPFYTETNDEIYIGRLRMVAPKHITMSVNPLAGGKQIFVILDIAEAIANEIMARVREARGEPPIKD